MHRLLLPARSGVAGLVQGHYSRMETGQRDLGEGEPLAELIDVLLAADRHSKSRPMGRVVPDEDDYEGPI